MLDTKNIKTSAAPDKRGRVQELKRYHTHLFEKENIINPKFIPRMCYPNKGELIIGFYPNELNGGLDIYTEFCSRDDVPEDPKRILYKWPFNPEYATEYAQSDPHKSTGDKRFLIPIEELINVSELHSPQLIKEEPEQVKEEPAVFIELPDASNDHPYADMTIRDYAAIQWKEPVSGKKWLNELITKTHK